MVFTRDKLLPVFDRLLIPGINDIIRLVHLLIVFIHVIQFIDILPDNLTILAH